MSDIQVGYYCDCESDWTDGTGVCEQCGKPRIMSAAPQASTDVTAALERLKKLDERLALKSAIDRMRGAEKRWTEAYEDTDSSQAERSAAYEEWYGEMRAFSTQAENVSNLLVHCNALPALRACAEAHQSLLLELYENLPMHYHEGAIGHAIKASRAALDALAKSMEGK